MDSGEAQDAADLLTVWKWINGWGGGISSIFIWLARPVSNEFPDSMPLNITFDNKDLHKAAEWCREQEAARSDYRVPRTRSGGGLDSKASA